MRPLTITLLQQELHWEAPQMNRDKFEHLILDLTPGAQLVILPEMFTTGFSMRPEIFAETMDGVTVTWMRAMAAKKKIILAGSLMIKEDGNYYNRLVWVLPNGSLGHYDKRHLFGFAGENKHFTPGKKRLIAAANGWRINLQVCYDLRFPVWSRNRLVPEEAGIMMPEYDLLVYVANWPERRKLAWTSLLQARAIENQCYVAGVNRVGKDGNGFEHSGDSMLIHPSGEVLYQGKHQEDVFTYTLSPESLHETRAKFPFLEDQDHFSIQLDA